MSTIEVMRKALDALENSLDLVQAEYTDNWRHGLPTRAAQLDGLKRLAEDHASAIEALRAEIERLGAAPSLTCQTFGEGVAVPCAECNTVLVDSQELAELRAMAARMATVEPVAWGRIVEGEVCDIICPSEHAREPGSYTVPLYGIELCQ